MDRPRLRLSIPRRALWATACVLTLLGGEPRRGLSAPAPVATGRIEGIVTVSSALVARRPRFRIYDDAGAPPAPLSAGLAAELSNVVMYLERSEGAPVAAPVRASLEQRDERFQPRVLAVPVHSTVDFPNRDRVFHNVFSLSRTRTFDLGRYPRDASKSVQLDKPGVVRVFCHIHADMSAVIVVVDGPGYAIPDSTGRYALESLPPGDYTLVGWHERSEPTRRTVHVVAGETTRIDMRIPIADAAPRSE
ncbi:MAG TPA: carboxypeptidase regulatory-like domain-containing protein [Gemmatimonadaceae bacterium]|nr:carboxypeptidase regulatory-like domain-containing protein [Gemmatimonadaceae bacterium]